MENISEQTKIKMEIEPNSQNISETGQSPANVQKGKLTFSDEFSKMYERSSVANYIRKIKKTTIKSFVGEILVLTESNCINELISKSIYVEYFCRNNYFSQSEIEILVGCFDKIIQKNKSSFYRFAPIFKALCKLLSNKKAKKAKISFDWKSYYNLFLIYYTKTAFEFQFRSYFLNKDKSFINKFFLKVHKYLTFTPQDIVFLRTEVKNLLFSGNSEKYDHAMAIMTAFLRKNRDFYDKEIQEILLNLLSNAENYNNVELYGIFRELVKHNNLLVDKEKFLNQVLDRIHEQVLRRELMRGQGLLIRRNPVSNESNDDAKKPRKLHNYAQQNLFLIISHFLIFKNLNDLENAELSGLRNLVKEKLSKTLNVLNFNLKENTNNDEIRYSLSNVKYFLLALKEQAFKKIKNGNNNNKVNNAEKSEKAENPPAEKLDLLENFDITFDQGEDDEDAEEAKEKGVAEYQIIPELVPQLIPLVTELIEPFITKSLFYQSNSSNELLYEVAEISESLPNAFLSENVFSIFMLLLNADENSSNEAFTSGNSNWSVVKINCFLKNFFKILLLNNNLNGDTYSSAFSKCGVTQRSLQSRFNSFVGEAIKNISSANIENSSHNIKLLARIFNLARFNYTEIKQKFPALLKTLEDSFPVILKKIVDLIEMISSKKFSNSVNIFYCCAAAYINSLADKNAFKKHIEQIEKMILGHIKENILDVGIVANLHSLIILLEDPEKKFYQSLFNHLYTSLVIERNESSKKSKAGTQMDIEPITAEDLYEKSELFPEIQIRRNIELDLLNEKNLKYLITLIEFLDCRYIEFNETNKQKVYNLIGLLAKSKDKFYLKILKSFANFVFNIVNKNIICYPKGQEEKEAEKIVMGEKLESLSLSVKPENEKNQKEKIIKSSLPEASKLNFCLEFISKLLNPLTEKLNTKAKDYLNRLDSKAQKEEKDMNAKFKALKNKKLKKKIKKETLEEITNEKAHWDQVHFKLMLGLAKRLNLLKNVFLLIPHKRNEKLYKHLLEDFNFNNDHRQNSVKLLDDFVNIKTEINKKIIDSKFYFAFFKTMRTKEVLEYYMSFDSYDFAEKITALKKFNSENKALLKKFKPKEKQIFSSKTRIIYLMSHLDLIKNFSHPDLPREKPKLTVLIHKILLNCSDNKFRKSYTQHMNYLFVKLHNKKDKKSFTDLNAIYAKIKCHYEKVIDKINPEETVSITLKTKLSNLVYAYSILLSFYLDSPAIEYYDKSSTEQTSENMQVEGQEAKAHKKTCMYNDFQINKLFLDLLEMKTKLYKQNIKELNFIVMNINIVYYNFFRFFPCSDYIINKKLLSKPDYLHFEDYRKSTENLNASSLNKNVNLLETENLKNYFNKENLRNKLTERIKFYSGKNMLNRMEFKKTLLDYFKIFVENLKSHNNKITNNIYLNYLMKFEAIYLMYYSMDLEDGLFYEQITEFQEYLLNILISDSGFLEKKFCFYLIGFISKLKYKIIIEYKTEKFEEFFNRESVKLGNSLSEEEKLYQLKLKYFNKSKQAVDPQCPADLHFLVEKTINYENLSKEKEIRNKAFDLKIMNFLRDEEKMKKFVEAYLLLKDNHKDQILNAELNEINAAAKRLFSTDLTSTMDKLLAPLLYPGKAEGESSVSYNRSHSLMSTMEANMIFYTFIVYDFNDFGMLNKIFESLNFKIKLNSSNTHNDNKMNIESSVAAEDKLDHVHMSVYLAFSSAHLRKMTINNRIWEKEIKDLFYLPLRQYGNISTEKVNREILTFYYFLLFNCSIEQLAMVLYDNLTLESINSLENSLSIKHVQSLLDTNNLILLKDAEFANNKILLLKFFNIFSEQNRALKFVFEKNSYTKFQENFLFNFLESPVDVIKNLNNYTVILGSYIAFSEYKRLNYKLFQEEYPNVQEFKFFLHKISEKCLSSESKKIKIVLNNLLVNYRNFILSNDEIFFEFLKQIIHFDSVDVDNYELVTKNLADIMITKYPGINVFKILDNLADILKKESLPASNTSTTEDNLNKNTQIMEIDSGKSVSANLNFTKKTIILNVYAGFLKHYSLSFNQKDNQIQGKAVALFNSLCEIMNHSQYEIRDYIANELLVLLLLTTTSAEKTQILENLISRLKSANANLYSVNSNLNKEESAIKISENLTAIFSLGAFLRFFDISSAHLKEIDRIVSAFKTFNSKTLKNKGVESKLIKSIITDFFNRYKNTFEYIKLSLSPEAIEGIVDLSKSHSYFM